MKRQKGQKQSTLERDLVAIVQSISEHSKDARLDVLDDQRLGKEIHKAAMLCAQSLDFSPTHTELYKQIHAMSGHQQKVWHIHYFNMKQYPDRMLWVQKTIKQYKKHMRSDSGRVV